MRSIRISRLAFSLRLLAYASALALGAPFAAAAGGAKVTVCHVPPGNPGNAHEIVVSPSAVPAHLANHPGDQLGPCQTAPECASDDQCADADPCTVDRCTATGSCDHSGVVTCDDGDVCTSDVCVAEQGGCVRIPNPGHACDDGDVCTAGDVCDAAGDCVASAVIVGCCRSDAECVDDAGLCTTDLCDVSTGICSHEPLACPAPDACMVAICDPELGCGQVDVRCPDDRDVCTVEFCDPSIGTTGACVTEPNPNPPVEIGPRCSDGRDNDCDGLVDGADPDCVAGCVPIAGREANCSDGRDDDCDGLVDGADPDCGGACTPTAASEVNCSDGIDDDCDGRIDSIDPDCKTK